MPILHQLSSRWIEKSLLINSTNTNYRIFHSTNWEQTYSVNIGEDSLVQVDCITFLGLHIDENVTWDMHVKYILSIISSGIFAIKRMKSISSVETLKSDYYALVYSHISYGIIFMVQR